MGRRAVAVSWSPSRLERRVAAAAEATLTRSKSVSPLDVLAQIGWLPGSLVDDRRHGRVDYLERTASVHPDKLATALEHLRRWAARQGLEPNESLTWPRRATGDRCGSPPLATGPQSAPGGRTGPDPTRPVCGGAGTMDQAAEQAA